MLENAPSRKEMLFDLRNQKLPISIIEYVAKYAHSSYDSRSKNLQLYDSLNDKAVKMLHEVFVENRLDTAGKYLQLRLARLAFKNHSEIVKTDIVSRLRGKSKAIHEIDVVGYDNDNQAFFVGEAKARKFANKDYVLKWMQIVEDLLKDEEYGESLYFGYFLSSGPYSEDTVRMIKDSIDSNGNMSVKTGIISSKYITMRFLEEREGKLLKVYPK